MRRGVQQPSGDAKPSDGSGVGASQRGRRGPRRRRDRWPRPRVRSGRSSRSARCSGSGRAHPGGPLDGVGELGRVGRGQRDHGVLARLQPGGAACPSPCAGRSASRSPHGRGGSRRASRRRSSAPPGTRRRDPALALLGIDRQPAGLAEAGELLGGARAVAVVDHPQHPLEVRRHLDVHRRAERRHDVRHRHRRLTFTKRVRMSLALEATTKSAIGAPIRRATHPAKTLPKLPVGTHDRDRSGQRPGRRHVVDGLGHHPRPVDRVDRGQPHPLAERGVVEHRLDEVLAVVERAVDGDGVHVGVGRPSSSAGAAPRSRAVRVQDHDVDVARSPAPPRSPPTRCRHWSRRRS